MYLRRAKREDSKLVSLDTAITRIDGYGEILLSDMLSEEDSNLNGVPDRIQLSNAIKRTPKQFKRAFLLREVHGFDTAETSKILGISVPATKSRHLRAKAFMREHLTR